MNKTLYVDLQNIQVLLHCQWTTHRRSCHCDLKLDGPGSYLRGNSHHSSPEDLVRVAFEDADIIQIELLEVGQPEELSGEQANKLLLLQGSVRRIKNMGEEEPTQIAHLAQVRSELPQSGQTPGTIYIQFLDRVELHHTQDVNVALRQSINIQLLTAKVQQTSTFDDFLN